MNEDWDEILNIMKQFSRIENITDIILLGDKSGEGLGIRRIIINNRGNKNVSQVDTIFAFPDTKNDKPNKRT